MRRTFTAAMIVTAVFLRPSVGSGQTVLTLEGALDRAREHAPAILAARARIEEARGRLRGAAIWLRDNPVIETLGGPRLKDHGAIADADVEVTQVFELGGRRGARIAGAEAGVAREAASSEDEARRLLRDVAAAFWRTVAARERLRLLQTAEKVAADLERTTERRHQAGDIADLDLNVARIAAARARSDRLALEAGLAESVGELKVLLGMEPGEPVVARGELGPGVRYELSALLAGIDDRPDLRALAAEAREADADVRLGSGFTWPDVGLRLGYQRDEQNNIPLAGFTLTLPVFSRGQELQATGAARAHRLRLELAASRRAAEIEIRSAFETYQRRLEAVQELEQRAVPGLDDNENLALRSYEERHISLPEFLLLRRESLTTRAEYIDRQLDAAVATIELQSRAGVLR
ncbi:MAG: TolC family protein [Candidatus Binatia bacterium]